MPLQSQFIFLSQMWQKDGCCIVRSVSVITEMNKRQAEDAYAMEKAIGILIVCNMAATGRLAGLEVFHVSCV